jgi:chromosome segregation ATPase
MENTEDEGESPTGEHKTVEAQVKHDLLLGQGRVVELEGKAITIVTKDALLEFIQKNLPQGVAAGDVLGFYQQIQKLEQERGLLKEQLATALLAKNDYSKEVEERRQDIHVLHQRLQDQEERLTQAGFEVAKIQQEMAVLAAHNAEVGGMVEDKDRDLANLLAEKEAIEDQHRLLQERYDDALNAADLQARVLELQERLTKLLDRIKQYQRDLTFAALVREPESKEVLAKLEALKEQIESCPEKVRGALERELGRMTKLITNHASTYPILFETMNERKATIDVVVSLCQIAREDALCQRELKFLSSLVTSLTTES